MCRCNSSHFVLPDISRSSLLISLKYAHIRCLGIGSSFCSYHATLGDGLVLWTPLIKTNYSEAFVTYPTSCQNASGSTIDLWYIRHILHSLHEGVLQDISGNVSNESSTSRHGSTPAGQYVRLQGNRATSTCFTHVEFAAFVVISVIMDATSGIQYWTLQVQRIVYIWHVVNITYVNSKEARHI